MALPNSEKITSQLATLPDQALKQMAMMHKADPYILPLIISEDGRRKQMRQAAQAQMAAMPQPKVADAALAQMGALPEEQGIGMLPAPNMQSMADGGIAGYGDGDDVPKRNGMAMGGMFDFAQRSEPVVRMAGGGMAGYMPSFSKTGAVNAAFEAALQKTLGYEGGYVADDAGKGPSNFGINASANPDVDVKNLTKDKARELYKKRYWDAIGGDALAAKDPALATIAFDTAVNMGVSKANQLVSKSKGDPSALLSMRQQHYDSLVKKDPEKFAPFEKGWKARVADLATSVIPSAEAGELPKQAAQAQPELDDGRTGTNVAKTGLGALITGAAVPSAFDAAAGATAKFAHQPANIGPMQPPQALTTAQKVGRFFGAAGTPLAVLQGGMAATDKAMSDLQYMSPEQRREMSSNPMLSAMSGDAGLASAIMDAAANNPEGPSKMSYADQMKNVGKALVQHPDIERQRLAAEAKRPKPEETKPAYDPNKMEPVRYDEFGTPNIEPEGLDMSKKQMDDLAKDAKAATPVEARKGLTNDDYLMMGLSLLASKSPNFATAFGEAGVQALGAKREREKTEGEAEYRKAQSRRLSAEADYLERGAKEKNMAFEAEKQVTDYMEKWDRNNKFISMQDPTARAREEKRIREQLYASAGVKPIMTGQASLAYGLSPADAQLVQKYLR